MALLLGVLGGVLAVELAAWIPHGSAWLVGRTLSRLPGALDGLTRDRWSEEIEADFATFADRPLAGLMFALRLRLRGARRLAAALALAERLKGPGEDVPRTAAVSVLGGVPQVIVARGMTPPERAQREDELCRILGEPDLRVVETPEEARRIKDFYDARARRDQEERL
jgi:hypothetical protein